MNASNASPLQCTQRLANSSTSDRSYIELTSSALENRGAAWFSSPVWGERFATNFSFSMTGPEGLAFVIKAVEVASPNVSTPATVPQSFIGPDGGGLGYGEAGTEEQEGIAQSLAIEFDAHQNTELLDPNSNHISVHARGSTLPNSASELYTLGWASSGNFTDGGYFPSLADGRLHTASLFYDLADSLLLVAIDDRPVLTIHDLDLLTLLLGPPSNSSSSNRLIWLGFTSAAGQQQASHAVYSWEYRYLGRVDAQLCSAAGQGLQGGAAGLQQVQVTTVDEFGHPTASVAFQVELSRVVVDSTAVLVGDGLWNVSYLAVAAGNAALVISVAPTDDAVNGSFAPLPGSPWIVSIEAGPMVPALSVASGQGLQIALVDVANVFELQLYDGFGNPVLSASATNVSGYLENQPNVLVASTYASEGRYRVSYQPYQLGPTRLRVFVDGEAIVGSPFSVSVVEAQVDVGNTVVSGPGLSAALCGRPAYFFVELRDQANNTVEAVARVHVKVQQTVCKHCSPVQLLELKTLVVPFGLGVYEATYYPELPTKTVVTIRVDDQRLPGGPFEFRASPGPADAEKSTASGNGLLFHVPDGNNQFFVQPRDRLSNPIKTDTVELVVRVYHKNASFPAQTRFVPSRGLYEVLYSAGKEAVEIDVAIQEPTGTLAMVQGSPFTVKPQGDQWLTVFLFGSLFSLLFFVGVLGLLVYYPRLPFPRTTKTQY